MTTPNGMSIEPHLRELIAQAKNIVGFNPEGNRSLYLEKVCDFERRHISPLRLYGPEAASLIETLTKADPVKIAIEDYRLADAEADAQQARFKSKTKSVNRPLTIAILIAVVLAVLRPENLITLIEYATWLINRVSGGWTQPLIGPPLSDEVAYDIKRVWNLLPFAVFAAMATNLLLQLVCKAHTNYEGWQGARAKAEAFRREIFRRMMAEPLLSEAAAKADSDGSAKAGALLLRLEYFRRWQCEVQQAYFKGRVHRLQGTLKKEKLSLLVYWIVASLLFLFMIVSSVSTLDEQGARSFLPTWLAGPLSHAAPVEEFGLDVVLLFAIILAGGLGYYYSLSAKLEDARRLFARYRIMQQNFDDISGERLEQTRVAAAQGNERAVREYMARVHGMMSLELNDWVRLRELDHGNDRATYQPSDTAQDAEDGDRQATPITA